MQTKEIQARKLTTCHELVRGGNGRPRTTHKLCEVGISGDMVEVRLAGTFERTVYQPREKVRVKADA